MKKVVKFGGSSLADAGQFQKVGAIIHADANRVYVVPSAPGKRSPKDTKVTDLLYRCYELAAERRDFSEPFLEIQGRYKEIIEGLSLDFSLEEEFRRIEEQLPGCGLHGFPRRVPERPCHGGVPGIYLRGPGGDYFL